MAAALLALFAAAVAVRGHGLDVSDEGYIVYPSVQLLAGLLPYRDVNTLYTPLAWYLHAGVFALFGVELTTLRVFFAGLVVALALETYALARQYVPARFAVVALVLFVELFPIPQTWTPYPAWYALAGLMGSLLALNRWLGDPRDRWLALAGVGCAVAFAAKPSLGLFGLLACCGFLLLQASELGALPGASSSTPARSGSLVPAVQVLFVFGTVAAFGLLVRPAMTAGNMLLFLGLTAAAGLVLVEWRPCAAASTWHLARATVQRGLWMVGAFVVVTLPWYAALSSTVGWGLVFRSVFQQGAATAAAFYEPVLPPNRDALEALAWLLGAAVVVLALGVSPRGRASMARPRVLWTLLGALLLVVLGGAAWRAAAEHTGLPDYLATNVATRWQRRGEGRADLPIYLPWLAAWGGVALLAWPRRGGQSRPVVMRLRLALLVWFLPLLMFQLYPRASFLHVLFSIPPFLVLLAVLGAEVWRFAAPRLPGPRSRGSAMAASLWLLPALLLPHAWRARATTLAYTDLVDLPHAGVYANPTDAARLLFVGRRLAALPPGEPIFAYPADATVYLLTDHPNPTREDYLPAGYVDAAGQREVIARLEASGVRYVVWDDERAQRWGIGEQDRPLADYLRTNFEPVGEDHQWLLLERRRA